MQRTRTPGNLLQDYLAASWSLILLIKRDLTRKPVFIFRDHAPG